MTTHESESSSSAWRVGGANALGKAKPLREGGFHAQPRRNGRCRSRTLSATVPEPAAPRQARYPSNRKAVAQPSPGSARSAHPGNRPPKMTLQPQRGCAANRSATPLGLGWIFGAGNPGLVRRRTNPGLGYRTALRFAQMPLRHREGPTAKAHQDDGPDEPMMLEHVGAPARTAAGNPQANVTWREPTISHCQPPPLAL